MPRCACGETWDRSMMGDKKCPRCLTTTNGKTRAQVDDETLWWMFPFSYDDIKAAETFDMLQRRANRQTLRAAKLLFTSNPVPDGWTARSLHKSSGGA